MTPGRQPLCRGVEIFEDAAARPVDVGAVLEDDVDERHAEEGEPAHDLRARHGQHRGRERIGDLVLDHLRRLPGELGVDDDLRVREVGDGVERQRASAHTPATTAKAVAMSTSIRLRADQPIRRAIIVGLRCRTVRSGLSARPAGCFPHR